MTSMKFLSSKKQKKKIRCKMCTSERLRGNLRESLTLILILPHPLESPAQPLHIMPPESGPLRDPLIKIKIKEVDVQIEVFFSLPLGLKFHQSSTPFFPFFSRLG